MAKTALVTGASVGIGYELAKLLARDGYELFLVARNSPKLDEVARELKGTAVAADLSDREGAGRVFAALQGAVPDVLINNAGFGMVGAFVEQELKTHLDMIQVNVTSLVELTRLFLPGMIARGSGQVMNVASTAAFQPGPLMAVYYASKAFVLSFTEAISEELRRTGVTATALCPGPTSTEFQARSGAEKTKIFTSGVKVMTAAEVARIGYAAMLQGKAVAITGWQNRLGAEGIRLAPRSWVRRIVYGLNSA
jgi:short-subunit dehydrogenase